MNKGHCQRCMYRPRNGRDTGSGPGTASEQRARDIPADSSLRDSRPSQEQACKVTGRAAGVGMEWRRRGGGGGPAGLG